MNKTISTSIGGFVFHLEEDGYAKLQAYLNEIRTKLGNTAECEEIMNDIESRIAELFFERLDGKREVIREDDIDIVINQMGAPSDYTEEVPDEELGGDTKTETPHQEPIKRKLYRDDEHATLGGVCAGIANYFDWDITWVRIAFVIFAIFGGGVLLYIALWIILPVPTNTKERLEMKGIAANAKNIREHVQRFGKEVSDLGKSTTGERLKDAGSQIGKSFGKIFGLGALFAGMLLLVILMYWVFTKDFVISLTNTGINGFNLEDLLSVTLTDTQGVLLEIGIILMAGGPIIGLFTLAIRLFFEIKNRIKALVIISTSMWVLGMAILTLNGISIGRDRSSSYDFTDKMAIETEEDIVEVDILDDIHFDERITDSEDYFFELLKIDNDSVYVGWPELDIHQSPDKDYHLLIFKESLGRTQKEAIRNSTSISYPVEVVGNQIRVAPYFAFDRNHLYKGQDVHAILQVPEGKSVKLSERMGRVLNNIDPNQHEDDDTKAGAIYTMLNKELVEHSAEKALIIQEASRDSIP